MCATGWIPEASHFKTVAGWRCRRHIRDGFRVPLAFARAFRGIIGVVAQKSRRANDERLATDDCVGDGKVWFLAMRWFAFILPVPDDFHQECKWSRLSIKLNSHWWNQWHTKSKAKAYKNGAIPPSSVLFSESPDPSPSCSSRPSWWTCFRTGQGDEREREHTLSKHHVNSPPRLASSPGCTFGALAYRRRSLRSTAG